MYVWLNKVWVKAPKKTQRARLKSCLRSPRWKTKSQETKVQPQVTKIKVHSLKITKSKVQGRKGQRPRCRKPITTKNKGTNPTKKNQRWYPWRGSWRRPFEKWCRSSTNPSLRFRMKMSFWVSSALIHPLTRLSSRSSGLAILKKSFKLNFLEKKCLLKRIRNKSLSLWEIWTLRRLNPRRRGK